MIARYATGAGSATARIIAHMRKSISITEVCDVYSPSSTVPETRKTHTIIWVHVGYDLPETVNGVERGAAPIEGSNTAGLLRPA
jgi:hypothetical protein